MPADDPPDSPPPAAGRLAARLADPVGRVRVVGLVEGASFLLLLGVALPLRRFAGLPEAVKVAGWAHGVLWVVYLAAVAAAARRLSGRAVVGALVASVVPFGPFLIDPRLRREEAAGPGRRPR